MMKTDKPFLDVLDGKKNVMVPFWFMRQAGRYLPEYREIREKAGGFLELVFDSERAAEVTLQPLRRYGMDAAILFSDILVVPLALGQKVTFETGEGPVLPPLREESDLSRLSMDRFNEILSPVYETVRTIRAQLAKENFGKTALIGFAGAPWTVACYMIEGRSGTGFSAAKNWAANDPRSFALLIDRLIESTICYLCGQIEAGAEAVQIFDSWAGILERDMFTRWVIEPTRRIVESLRKNYPAVPVIGFPRNAGKLYRDYIENTGITAAGMDQNVSLTEMQALQKLLPVQGNLDPEILLRGGKDLDRQANSILEALSGRPFIFNLGHGILKETPPEHVARLSNIVREWQP